MYGNRWEQMRTNAAALTVGPRGDYAPPFPLGPASNPRVYLGIRAGGVELGRVVVELRADAAPLAAENFRALCEFGVYKGAIFHRIFPEFIVQVRAARRAGGSRALRALTTTPLARAGRGLSPPLRRGVPAGRAGGVLRPLAGALPAGRAQHLLGPR